MVEGDNFDAIICPPPARLSDNIFYNKLETVKGEKKVDAIGNN